MKRVLFIILLSVLLLTGCNNENEKINIESKQDWENDDIHITLNKNWWVQGFTVDYENKQVILNIEKELDE